MLFGNTQKADVEGYSDVNVILMNLGRISHASMHYSVTQHIPENIMQLATQQTLKITFSPPPGIFTLCKYKISGMKRIPIRGFYQMKEISRDSVQILVQLKLDEDMKNEFEYCDCIIPFKHMIKSHKIATVIGTLAIGYDKRSLVWRIGNKFKTMELSLPGRIYFETHNPSETIPDPFLVGNNSYVKVR